VNLRLFIFPRNRQDFRIVPLAMVDDMMGGIVRVTWRKMERYVMHDRARSGSQKGWEWFQ